MILKIALESSEDGRWFAILLSSDEEVEALAKNCDEKSIESSECLDSSDPVNADNDKNHNADTDTDGDTDAEKNNNEQNENKTT